MLVDGHGIPLCGITTKANAHDVRSAIATIDLLRIGKRRRRPKRVRADKGYDGKSFRQQLRKRGIKSAVDHRAYPHRKRPQREWDDHKEIRYAPCRWKVEQRWACLDQNRRLNFLYEKKRSRYEGFLTLAMIRVYLQRLLRCKTHS